MSSDYLLAAAEAVAAKLPELTPEKRERIAMLLSGSLPDAYVPAPPPRAEPRPAPAPPPEPLLSGVYFARAGDAIKIGVSVDVRRRVRELSTASPVALDLLAVLPGGVDEERALHGRFASSRLNGEWFRAQGELIAYIATLPPLPAIPRRAPLAREVAELDSETWAELEDLAAIEDPVARAREVAARMGEVAGDTARLAAIRRQAVLEMRDRGMSLADIARELGLHRNRVQQIAEGRSSGGQGGKVEQGDE